MKKRKTCKDCKHFKRFGIGSRGGYRGICELSASDKIWLKRGLLRYGSVKACKRQFEEAE